MLYFFVALTVVALGYFIAWPLIGGAASSAGASTLHEKAAPSPSAGEIPDRLTRALAEIDFDHSTGKTNDEDWQAARAPIEAQLQSAQTAGADARVALLNTELEIEIHVARARLRRKATPA